MILMQLCRFVKFLINTSLCIQSLIAWSMVACVRVVGNDRNHKLFRFFFFFFSLSNLHVTSLIGAGVATQCIILPSFRSPIPITNSTTSRTFISTNLDTANLSIAAIFYRFAATDVLRRSPYYLEEMGIVGICQIRLLVYPSIHDLICRS